MLFLSNVCEKSSFLKGIYFIKELIHYTCILLPIGLIIMIMIDLIKNVISKGEDMNKNIKMAGKRILYCIIVFLIPTVVNLSVSILNQADISINYNECLTNANLSSIKGFEETEEEIKEDSYTAKAPTDPNSGNRRIVSGGNSNNNNNNNNNDDDDDFDDSDAPTEGAQRILYYAEKFYQKVEKNPSSWKHRKESRSAPNVTSCCRFVSKKVLKKAGYLKDGYVCHDGGGSKPTGLHNLKKNKVNIYYKQSIKKLVPGDVVVYSKPGSGDGNIAVFAKKKNGNYYFYGASSGGEIRAKSHPNKRMSGYWKGKSGKLTIIRAKN